MKSNTTSFFKNISILLCSLLLSLIVAEAMIRIFGDMRTPIEKQGVGYHSFYQAYNPSDEPDMFKFKPNQLVTHSNNEFHYEFNATSEGYAYGQLNKNEEGKRILFIGDSFTEGVGAHPDSSYPKLVNDIMYERSANVELLNAGISGSDVVYGFRLFQKKLMHKQPHIVVLAINRSDINDVEIRGGFERFKADGSVVYRSAPAIEFYYRHSHLVRLFAHNFLHLNHYLLPLSSESERANVALDKICVAIDSFQLQCKVADMKLLVVFHPTLPELDGSIGYTLDKAIQYCKAKNMEVIDLKPLLEHTHISLASIYWPMDGHFNNMGYKILADTVANRVAAMSL